MLQKIVLWLGVIFLLITLSMPLDISQDYDTLTSALRISKGQSEFVDFSPEAVGLSSRLLSNFFIGDSVPILELRIFSLLLKFLIGLTLFFLMKLILNRKYGFFTFISVLLWLSISDVNNLSQQLLFLIFYFIVYLLQFKDVGKRNYILFLAGLLSVFLPIIDLQSGLFLQIIILSQIVIPSKKKLTQILLSITLLILPIILYWLSLGIELWTVLIQYFEALTFSGLHNFTDKMVSFSGVNYFYIIVFMVIIWLFSAIIQITTKNRNQAISLLLVSAPIFFFNSEFTTSNFSFFAISTIVAFFYLMNTKIKSRRIAFVIVVIFIHIAMFPASKKLAYSVKDNFENFSNNYKTSYLNAILKNDEADILRNLPEYEIAENYTILLATKDMDCEKPKPYGYYFVANKIPATKHNSLEYLDFSDNLVQDELLAELQDSNPRLVIIENPNKEDSCDSLNILDDYLLFNYYEFYSNNSYQILHIISIK